MRFTPRTLAAVLAPLTTDDAKTVRDLTARKALALFDVPVSKPLPDSLFTETKDNDTE